MFWLFLIVSIANFAIGFALAVQLGWAEWPRLRASSAAGDAHATPNDHAPPAKVSGHGHH